jgi:transglutaminase-like putative cysteine protease
MGKALLVAGLGAPLLAWSWMSLESGHDAGQATLVVLLAIAAAVVRPRNARIVACVAALLVAGAIAFGLGHIWALPGRILSRFGSGFLEFYDYQMPFDPAAHPRMHGVLLLALFAFTLAFALAVAARRPGLAATALVVGVGWPGTLLPGHDLLRGCLLLIAVLATAVVLRPGPVRGVGAALAAGTLVLLGALAATSSPALAKRAFLDWQHWDPYTKAAKPVDVSYVWNSSYRGLTFHGKPTTVLRVKAGPETHYWRVSVLNTVENGTWFEEVSPTFGDPPVPLGQAGLVPPRELRRSGWEEQHVTIEALRDNRLPGGSVPVRFEPGSSIGNVSYDTTGVAMAEHPLSRGDTYDVWSYAPSPTPAQLAASKPIYSGPIVAPRLDEYREVQPGVYPRLFGTPGQAAYVHYLMTDFARADQLKPFRRLQALAEHVAGGARSPYAAAVALEQWFRFGGGFVYDQHPPKTPAGVAPLEDFVARTTRGYCQHFAGAMALMLRYLGIPSRVAVGFGSGRYQHGEWVVSDRDAHMWVEVWFRGWGWVPFDPTPGRGGLAGSYSASSPSFDITAAAAVLAGKKGFRQFGDTLANTLGFGTKARTSPDVPQLGATAAGTGSTSSHPRDWGILRLLALALLAALVLLVVAKLLRRGSRFLTRDPRRLAGACRGELRDFLLDQGMDVPASATLRELAALVEAEFRVETGAFGLHATAARFAPAVGAREAARAMRRDLRALRRGLRRELSRSERIRGLLSLRSLGLA